MAEIWAGFFIFFFNLLESRGKEKRPSFFFFPSLTHTQRGHAYSLLRSKLLTRQGTSQVLLKCKISFHTDVLMIRVNSKFSPVTPENIHTLPTESIII